MGLYDVVKTEWFEQCLVRQLTCVMGGCHCRASLQGVTAGCSPLPLQREGRCVPLVPNHMIYTSPQTAESFSQLFDRHGDSYREPATEESLRTVFGVIAEMASDKHYMSSLCHRDVSLRCVTLMCHLDVCPQGTPVSISQEEIALVESKYFTEESPLGLFRQYR